MNEDKLKEKDNTEEITIDDVSNLVEEEKKQEEIKQENIEIIDDKINEVEIVENNVNTIDNVVTDTKNETNISNVEDVIIDDQSNQEKIETVNSWDIPTSNNTEKTNIEDNKVEEVKTVEQETNTDEPLKKVDELINKVENNKTDVKVENDNKDSKIEENIQNDKVEGSKSDIKTNNDNTPKVENVKNVKPKSKARPIIISIFLIALFGSFIFFMPDILEYVKNLTEKEPSTNTPAPPVNNQDNDNDKVEEEYKSGINIVDTLKEIQNETNYMYNIKIDANSVDNNNEGIKKETNISYRFNPNKYEIYTTITSDEISSSLKEYYEKNNEDYIFYKLNTTNNFIKEELDKEEYANTTNVLYNLTSAIINNNELKIKENTFKNENNEELIKISVELDKDILNSLLINSSTNDINIDLDKFEENTVTIEFIFSEDKKLLYIESAVQTKDSYIDSDIKTDISVVNISYKIYNFNNISNIEIPFVQ